MMATRTHYGIGELAGVFLRLLAPVLDAVRAEAAGWTRRVTALPAAMPPEPAPRPVSFAAADNRVLCPHGRRVVWAVAPALEAAPVVNAPPKATAARTRKSAAVRAKAKRAPKAKPVTVPVAAAVLTKPNIGATISAPAEAPVEEIPTAEYDAVFGDFRPSVADLEAMAAAAAGPATVTVAIEPGKSCKSASAEWTPEPGRVGCGGLVVRTGRVAVAYAVTEFPTPWPGRAFHLEKLTPGTDKDETDYDVFVGANGQDRNCSCKGFERFGHCKHSSAVLALVRNGLI